MCNMTCESHNSIAMYALACHMYNIFYIEYVRTADDWTASMHASQILYGSVVRCVPSHMWPHVCVSVRVFVSSFVRSLIFERFSFFFISFLGDRNYTNRHCCVRFVEHISFRSCVLPTSLPANFFLLRARVRLNISVELHRSLYFESFNFFSVIFSFFYFSYF